MIVTEVPLKLIEQRKKKLSVLVAAVVPAVVLVDNRSVGYGYGSFFCHYPHFDADSDADIVIFPSVDKDIIQTSITAACAGVGNESWLDVKIFDHYFPPLSQGWSFIQKISQNWVLLFKDGQIYF